MKKLILNKESVAALSFDSLRVMAGMQDSPYPETSFCTTGLATICDTCHYVTGCQKRPTYNPGTWC
jgi:hypothetical protein